MRKMLRHASPAMVLVLCACGGASTAPTHPVTGAMVPDGTTRIIVGGDSRDDSAHVLPWAFREAKARGASAFLFLGDMELTPSLDAHFRKELDLLAPIPFYPALGNHEVRVLGAVDIGAAAAERSFRDHFLGNKETPVQSSIDGKVVYSVNLPGHIHYVTLDNVSQKGFGKDQLRWLAADLEQARSDSNVRHIFVGMHKPLAHNGVATHGMDADGPDAEADSNAALDLFEHAHVELILASHVHQFIRFNQRGIRSYITGGLGAPLNNNTPEHGFHHFLVIDVTGDQVRVDVVRFDGPSSMGTDDIAD
jgi:3',5'-cyclic AMP phosphodiesterase CpdA